MTEKFPLFRILLLRYYNPILSNFVDLRNGEQCANNNKVMTFKLKNEFIISYEFGVLFLVYITVYIFSLYTEYCFKIMKMVSTIFCIIFNEKYIHI